MLKELRYFFYVLFVFLFLFLTLKFYFSDTNKKKSYRSFKEIDDKLMILSDLKLGSYLVIKELKEQR